MGASGDVDAPLHATPEPPGVGQVLTFFAGGALPLPLPVGERHDPPGTVTPGGQGERE